MASANEPQVISFRSLQLAIGILGISLPIVLLLGTFILNNCTEVQCSISNYYHTKMRNIFVGYLFALSLFFWTYKGYKDSKLDNIFGYTACLFGFGVIFFPTSMFHNELNRCFSQVIDMGWIGVAHLISACMFLILLAFYSIVLFTRGQGTPTPQKIKRNKLYRICGYSMLAAILLMAIHVIFIRPNFPEMERFKPIFVLETLSLWAFGLSWLTKGGLFFKDQ